MAVDAESLTPFQLSIDMRVQHALRDELVKGIAKYKAIAGSGIIYDVTTGEIIALASYPDFDPNITGEAQKGENINRAMVRCTRWARPSRRSTPPWRWSRAR